MVRINRVYTRKGDAGETSLVGGRAVFKDEPRVQCFGTVDELNAVIGVARALNAEKAASPDRDGFDPFWGDNARHLPDLGDRAPRDGPP